MVRWSRCTGNPLRCSDSSLCTGYHLNDSMGSDEALRRIRTTGSLSISPELFEKIYLSPQNKVAGDLRKTFGNPTPLYVVQPTEYGAKRY
jgi:hypothetical protein